MKAITYTQPGDSSVLSLAERPLPEPGPGEVRVRIVVSGVNPTDWKARATTGRPLPFDEVTPNQDGAGIVDAVGPDVDGLAVGQRVWVYLAAHQRPTGTAAQYSVLPAARAVPLADGASFELGASLGVPAMTAHRALTVHEDGPSRLAPGALAGRTVLVQGVADGLEGLVVLAAHLLGQEGELALAGDMGGDLPGVLQVREQVVGDRQPGQLARREAGELLGQFEHLQGVAALLAAAGGEEFAGFVVASAHGGGVLSFAGDSTRSEDGTRAAVPGSHGVNAGTGQTGWNG